MDANVEMIVLGEATRRWSQLFGNDYWPACSGVGSCDHCNSVMYPRRTEYLKEWLCAYLQHKEAIKEGRMKMPRLDWVSADSASFHSFGEFHKLRCPKKKLVQECDCELVNLWRSMYKSKSVQEEIKTHSLEQIYGLWKNMHAKREKTLAKIERAHLLMNSRLSNK